MAADFADDLQKLQICVTMNLLQRNEDDPMVECNEEKCICPHKECVHHGKCCECVNGHRTAGSLPYCLQLMMDKKKEDEHKKSEEKKTAAAGR